MSSLATEAMSQRDSEREMRQESTNDRRDLVPEDPEDARFGGSSHCGEVHRDQAASSNSADKEDSEPTGGPSRVNYFTQYRWMREYMPHWVNTFCNSRTSESTIRVYSADNHERLQECRDVGDETRSMPWGEAIPATSGVQPFNLPLDRSHTILVQDISPNLINTLGKVLNIAPDVFDEHLHRSGYRGGGGHMDGGADPRTWWTKHQGIRSTEHKTLRWLSVVDCGRKGRRSDRDVDEILNGCERMNVNVFRPNFALGIDIGLYPTVIWEEKVTCFKQRWPATANTAQHEQIVLFVDPLPKLIVGSGSERHDTGDQASTSSSESLAFQRATPRPPPVIGIKDHSQNRDIFKQYANSTQSTVDDIEAWMSFLHVGHRQAGDNTQTAELGRSQTPPPAISALLEVIYIDTICLLNHLSVILDSISPNIMNERLMQQRLTSWRTLLNWAQHELPQLSESLTDFFAFATAPPCNYHKSDPYEQPVLPNQLILLQKKIQAVISRCERTQEHLRAEMSLLESKRGIAQAESVTRLIELAFIFIPMSFAAALFSMQLKELEEAPPHAWMFVVTALGFVVLAYALRLLARSPTIGWYIHGVGQRIRSNMGVVDGVAIPAHTVVRWVWRKFRYRMTELIGCLLDFMCIMCCLPLMLLSTSLINAHREFCYVGRYV